MIKQYVLPAVVAGLLGGCSMMGTSTVDVSPAPGESRFFHSFSELTCQTMPLSPEKSGFNVSVGQGSDSISLASGQSPVLSYALPETGFHKITIASTVLHNGKDKKQVFYPQVSLLDREGKEVRVIGADQAQYQKPGFMTGEGVMTSFVVDNRVKNPATCMVIYTTDQARQGKTKLINEAKEYAKVRGTVALPVPDIYASHGNKGTLTITLKSSPGYVPAQEMAPSINNVKSPSVLAENDPFNQRLRKYYLKEVGDSLQQGEVTRALDKRSELKEIARAMESYFATLYQRGSVNKTTAVNSRDFSGQALYHYQEKITNYLKEGKASAALQVIDQIKAIQSEVDTLFDR